MFSETTALQRISLLSKRIRGIQGGTAAGKTIAILLLLINMAQEDTTPTITSVVSESFPHLKRGAIRDFLLIMELHGYYKDDRWNKTDYTYEFETGSKIEFFSADQPDKVRGPRRDRLFINEANNVPYDTFDQLEVRTRELVYLDWNPVADYWFYDRVANRSDCENLIVTYRDNEALEQSIVQSIEQRRANKNWWKVYGEGQLGEIEGRIYKDWQIIDEIPHEARLVKYGLDFGYTNDPTAVVAIYFYNGGYIWDEVVYQQGMSNRQIADVLLNEQKSTIIADSAEPKSIDELSSYGLMVLPCAKGPGSVNQRIQFVQEQRISVTKRSLNIIKEYRNYMWQTDRNGKILNIPSQGFDHAMDGGGYAIASEFPRRKTNAELDKLKTEQEFLKQFDSQKLRRKATFGSRERYF